MLRACAILTLATVAGADFVETVTHQQVDRPYLVHLPQGWDGLTPLPLLVGLHGGSGSKESFGGTNGFNEVADREGFIVVYPDAIDGVWNDGRPGSRSFRLGIDDVGFLEKVIDRLVAELAIDTDRIYVTGTSNGGMMTHRLAAEMGATPGGVRLAGFAPMVANLPEDLIAATDPDDPLHAFLLFGSIDPLMPFDGGPVAGGQGGLVVSAEETRDYWLEELGIPDVVTSELGFDDVNGREDGLVSADFYDTPGGADLAYYVVDGGGHAVPGSTSLVPDVAGWGPTNRDIRAAEEIWQFFSTRPRLTPVDLPGDYNGDGAVDAADYTVWRDSPVNATLPGDQTGGSVDADDLARWRVQYGVNPAATMAAPEPDSAVVAMISVAIGAALLRRVDIARQLGRASYSRVWPSRPATP